MKLLEKLKKENYMNLQENQMTEMVREPKQNRKKKKRKRKKILTGQDFEMIRV